MNVEADDPIGESVIDGSLYIQSTKSAIVPAMNLKLA